MSPITSPVAPQQLHAITILQPTSNASPSAPPAVGIHSDTPQEPSASWFVRLCCCLCKKKPTVKGTIAAPSIPTTQSLPSYSAYHVTSNGTDMAATEAAQRLPPIIVPPRKRPDWAYTL